MFPLRKEEKRAFRHGRDWNFCEKCTVPQPRAGQKWTDSHRVPTFLHHVLTLSHRVCQHILVVKPYADSSQAVDIHGDGPQLPGCVVSKTVCFPLQDATMAVHGIPKPCFADPSIP
jgi:hypothetical protein